MHLKYVSENLYNTCGVESVRKKPKECAMANDFENFQNERQLLNKDIQNKMAILMGAEPEKQVELTREQKKQITKNYIAMYYSLAWLNWCNGMSLGTAWQKALEQMDGFVVGKAKIANHPMIGFLKELHAKHRQKMAKEIMTSKYADIKLELDSQRYKDYVGNVVQSFEENKNALNDLYNQLMPKQKTAEHDAKQPFKMAQDKALQMMQQLLWIKRAMGQRSFSRS